jgi:hypothetical protein
MRFIIRMHHQKAGMQHTRKECAKNKQKLIGISEGRIVHETRRSVERIVLIYLYECELWKHQNCYRTLGGYTVLLQTFFN